MFEHLPIHPRKAAPYGRIHVVSVEEILQDPGLTAFGVLPGCGLVVCALERVRPHFSRFSLFAGLYRRV